MSIQRAPQKFHLMTTGRVSSRHQERILLRALAGIALVAVVMSVTSPKAEIAFAVAPQDVTEIWTDFGGYWNSSTTDAAAGSGSYTLDFPDTAHNLLAFTWSGTTYSTGVNDATLTSNSVTFTADQWSALPIDQITYGFACSAASSNG
ncbi:MAG: hypothetical protein QNL06_06730, partial [Pontimonas sp.]